MKLPVSFHCCLALLAAAFLPVAAQARMFEISGGVSKTFNARWTESLFSMNEKLSYNMETTDFTMFEGKICNMKTGLALGIDVDIDDNYVGRANRVAGHLGFNRLYLRFHNGDFRGTALWKGTLAPGQTTLTPFKGSVTHVDLIYWRKKFPMYFGLGYTAAALPVEVMTTYTTTDLSNQKKAVPFFDTEYRGTYYSFLFGLDTFTSSMLYQDTKEMSVEGRQLSGDFKTGWGLFMVAQDRFGFGSDRISDSAMAAARTLNPGKTPVGNTFFSAYIENTSSMGLRWRGVTRYGNIAVGIGYELAFLMILDMTGAAKKNGDLGIMPQSSVARYGPVTRLYLQF